MSSSNKNHGKQLHFFIVMLISFALFSLGYIIDQTIRWSEPLSGFINGMFHVFVFGIVWCVYLLPWNLIIFGLYRWRKWARFRTPLILAPACLALLLSLIGLATNPPTPSNRFKAFTKIDLPHETINLHYFFSGGGITDYTDIYYFETSSDEVTRLITQLELEQDKTRPDSEYFHCSIRVLPNCPDYLTWTGATYYRGWDERQHWFYELITDSSRTKVYVMIGCI